MSSNNSNVDQFSDEFRADKENTNSLVTKPIKFHLRYFVLGIIFGAIAVKSEIISWFRIQEMFRFQSFHMYGIIGTAVVIGIASIAIIKKYKIKDIDGKMVEIEPKKFNKGQIYGGLIFGVGWALTGACPGPIFALIGNGIFVGVIMLMSAIAGTWAYGYLKNKLSH